MHAFILTGGTSTSRNKHVQEKLNQWHVQVYDSIVLNPERTTSIGIADVRSFIRRLTLVPQYSAYSVGIIHDAYLLTPEAQNSLLKTLEEPPPHVRIILEAPTLSNLLPTVCSRCVIENDFHSNDEPHTGDYISKIHTILTASPGKKLAHIEQLLGTQPNIRLLIDTIIADLRDDIIQGKSDITRTQATRIIHALLAIRQKIEVNISLQTALDIMFLSL